MTAKRSVLVTGASTGIGEASVELLIEAGFFVFGNVRKEADARRLESRYGGERFAPLFFDVTDGAAIARAAREAERRLDGAALFGLVNNAGAAFPAPLLHQPIEEFRRQIEINLIGQLSVVQAFAPLLGAGATRMGRPGRIVNMSSVAGSLATPFLGAYGASKHALEGFSDALRRELMIFGVDVVVIEPGVIATPIWDKAELVDAARFDETVYGAAVRRLQKWAVTKGREGAPPALVAKAVLRGLTQRRPPPRIRVVSSHLFDWTVPRLLPTRALDWLIARRAGLLPDAGRPAAPSKGAPPA